MDLHTMLKRLSADVSETMSCLTDCAWVPFVPQVDMTKVNLEVIKPWITQRVTEILGFEDDVVIEFIFNQLEEKVIS